MTASPAGEPCSTEPSIPFRVSRGGDRFASRECAVPARRRSRPTPSLPLVRGQLLLFCLDGDAALVENRLAFGFDELLELRRVDKALNGFAGLG
jgi:hypothetical protein